MNITSVKAREILSSGAVPSLEVKAMLSDGSMGVASVPFGASAGIHEAFVLLDHDKKRFMGNGMLKAINNINKVIAPKLKGKDAAKQIDIDNLMKKLDGTPNKSRLGANAILGASMAVAKAAAASKKIPLYAYIRKAFGLPIRVWTLPNPMMVVIEGGKHADNSTDLQEYMITPYGRRSARENVRMGIEVYFHIRKVLKSEGYNTNVGNEGAFAPVGLQTNETPLRIILEGIMRSGYKPGKDVGISLDPAVSEIFEEGRYILKKENKKLTSKEMVAYLEGWIKKYPAIVTLEDGLAEDDWEHWPLLNKAMGKRVAIVTDDLTVTNPERLQRAIDTACGNAILIKLNQIGTLSETVETCMLARKHGWITIVSHRGGGETNDTSMVDVAVAVNAAAIKVGPSRGERVCKYNRLMEIEEELGKKATAAGKGFRRIT